MFFNNFIEKNQNRKLWGPCVKKTNMLGHLSRLQGIYSSKILIASTKIKKRGLRVKWQKNWAQPAWKIAHFSNFVFCIVDIGSCSVLISSLDKWACVISTLFACLRQVAMDKSSVTILRGQSHWMYNTWPECTLSRRFCFCIGPRSCTPGKRVF